MKNSWRAALGLALTIGLLWWAFRGVEWTAVRTHLASADVLLLGLAVIVGSLMFPLRAIRWRPILHPVAPNLPFGPLWRATTIGMMANNILPARIGELVRAFVLSRETTVSYAAAFASLVVDRVFDAMVVLLTLLAAMYAPDFPGGTSASTIAGATTVVVVAACVGLYAIVFFPDRLIGVFEMFAQRLAPRFEAQGRALLRSFADGLGVLRHPGRFAVVFSWATALWVVQAVAFWMSFRAFGIAVPLSAAFFVQGLIVIGVAAPSTPGYFGPFEFAAIYGLGLYGVDASLAAAWALTYHVLSLIPITVIGLYYTARGGMKLGE